MDVQAPEALVNRVRGNAKIHDHRFQSTLVLMFPCAAAWRVGYAFSTAPSHCPPN